LGNRISGGAKAEPNTSRCSALLPKRFFKGVSELAIFELLLVEGQLRRYMQWQAWWADFQSFFDGRFNVFAIFTPLYGVQIEPIKYFAHACPKMAVPNPLF
jgi:hypothetical protein